MSFAIWKTRSCEQLHGQLSYVSFFHITIDRRVIRDMEKKAVMSRAHLHLSYVHIVHIAIVRRVIRDMDNNNYDKLHLHLSYATSFHIPSVRHRP